VANLKVISLNSVIIRPKLNPEPSYKRWTALSGLSSRIRNGCASFSNQERHPRLGSVDL